MGLPVPDGAEQKEALKFVHDKALHGYLYPMLVFTAHTGARRSEMLRARVTDIDFNSNSAVLREKKRVRECGRLAAYHSAKRIEECSKSG